MRQSRFSEAQIIGVLREQESGAMAAEVRHRHGISEQTVYRWKAKYGGWARRMRSAVRPSRTRTETEEAAGGIDAGRRGAQGPFGKKLSSPAARRMAARRLMAAHGFSQRHACKLVEVDPKTVRRAAERGCAGDPAKVRDRAGERWRFGYRRLGILLAREGITMNHKKLYRLYREEGLTVQRRRGRKRATGTRAPITIPQAADQRWSLDFVADVLSWGRRFRVLAIVDDFTREALALVADTSTGGRRVVRELDALIAGAAERR